MKLCEGKIGMQESAGLIGLSCAMGVIFTADSQLLYANGNVSYISLPLSVAAALGLFFLLQRALRASGARNLCELMQKSVGKGASNITGLVAVVLFVFCAWSMLERFTMVLHSSVYMKSDYAPLLLWCVAPVAFMAILGLECLGRTAKCFAVPIALLMIFGFIGASTSFSAYRLLPLPSGLMKNVAVGFAEGFTPAFSPFLAILVSNNALQGGKNASKAAVAGACGAFVLVLVAQLSLGMIYEYNELKEMLMPMFRVNMKLIRDSYWFRLDKVGVFIWLVGCVVGSAFYVYSASSVMTRLWTRFDTRPTAASVSACIALVLGIEHVNDSMGLYNAILTVKNYAWCAALLFPALAVAAIIKAAIGRRKGNEAC